MEYTNLLLKSMKVQTTRNIPNTHVLLILVTSIFFGKMRARMGFLYEQSQPANQIDLFLILL